MSRLILGIGALLSTIVLGCNAAPSASTLLPDEYGPPYLLISERLDDMVAERCYGVLYGGVQTAGEVCYHVLVMLNSEDARGVIALQRGVKGWNLLGTPRLGEEAHEMTATYCTGDAPNLDCEWVHYLSVREGQAILMITRSDEGYATSMAEAESSVLFKFFSESAFLQAESILAS